MDKSGIERLLQQRRLLAKRIAGIEEFARGMTGDRDKMAERPGFEPGEEL